MRNQKETRPSRQANGRECKSNDSLARGDVLVAAFALFGALAVPALAATVYQAVVF